MKRTIEKYLPKFEGEDGAGAGASGATGGEGGENNGAAASWVESLPESVRDWKEVADAGDTPDKFWDNMGQMRSHIGNSIRIPGDDAGPEAIAEFNAKLLEKVPGVMPAPDRADPDKMNAFYNAIGRPEEAAKYAPPEMEGVHEGVVTAFRDIAYNNGLSQAQFEGVVKQFTEHSNNQQQAGQELHQRSMESLKTEWGVTFDTKYESAKKIAEATKAPEVLIKAFEDKSIGADAVKWLNSLAATIGSEGQTILDQGDGEQQQGFTPHEAEAQIQEIVGNKSGPYWDKSHPDHKRLVTKVLSLQKMITPGETVI